MEKINRLIKLFKYYNLDGYIIPKNDEFFSEYVNPNKDNLRYISNFTGSYGFALILKKKNYLFVDGRYTLQAKLECGKFFNILNVSKYLPSKIIKSKRTRIGFDPRLFTSNLLTLLFGKNKCKLISINKNLIQNDNYFRNKQQNKKFYKLPKKAVGENYKLKLKNLLEITKRNDIDTQFITASENIAWLLNIRGQDADYSPIPNSYLLIDQNKKINFFCNLKSVDRKFRNNFDKINFVDIKNTDLFISRIEGKKILLDKLTCSFYFENIIKKNNKIIQNIDPIYQLKSTKSKNEIKNSIRAHNVDGAALTKFLFWVKKNYNKGIITEISAQEKLFSFRKKNKSFRSLSFPTISGSGPNGAIIHYKANKKTNRLLQKGDIYLVDSGGQYYYGTTDVTRTISLGNNNKKIREIFTRVLKGHIAVAKYKIKKNINGSHIDNAARRSLKEISLDYAHGTGHGVGYFLNVHEGPHGISKNNKNKFKEGMIISNEPGYYKNGKFGIRIENLLYIKKNGKDFKFENLTMAPIDKSLIDKKILRKDEKQWLNNYHNKVFQNLKRLMNKSEKLDLKMACSKI